MVRSFIPPSFLGFRPNYDTEGPSVTFLILGFCSDGSFLRGWEGGEEAGQ